jgi:hypothetical protein
MKDVASPGTQTLRAVPLARSSTLILTGASRMGACRS